MAQNIHSCFVEYLDSQKFKSTHARDGRNMHKGENINILLGKGGIYIHLRRILEKLDQTL